MQDSLAIGFGDDLGFFAAQAAGFDFVVAIAFGGGHFVLSLRPFVDFDLHRQHLAEAALKGGQRAGDFFLAQLSQDLFGSALASSSLA